MIISEQSLQSASAEVSAASQFVWSSIVSGILSLGMHDIDVFIVTLVPGLASALLMLGVFLFASRPSRHADAARS